jgi:tetratricopeptide (TPR) repeat protein
MAKLCPILILASLLFSSGPGKVRGQDGAQPLFDGLGSHSRKITTNSAEAQRYFDQGLAFMYAFNHDESIRSFRRAAELDRGCAMAFWGISIANGPHINNPVMPQDRVEAALEALTRAKNLSAEASPVEQALIRALEARYVNPPPEDRKPLDQKYADAMREVWRSYPKDADVGALFAESLADLRPWDLWTAEGEPLPGTGELIEALRTVLALDPKHPLGNHLLIHAVEASPRPEQADAAADMLRDLQPGLGHMVHMPSHIDVRRGRWQQAITANTKAIEADRRYSERSRKQDFYRLYMAHNHHMLTYAAMMTGQSALALKTIREMVAAIPLESIRENPFLDGFIAMPLEVMMRFGRWDDILAEPAFPDYAPISRALQHYARAVAHAAKDNIPDASKEKSLFAEARTLVPKDAFFGNNSGSDVLDVAESFMTGEILFRSGDTEKGVASLRQAAEREDKLKYDEPPSWIQPVRHALGAALLQSGRYTEAEKVFREDLARLPGNGWGLYGLMRSLQVQKKNADADAVEKQFDDAWKKGDIRLKSPCLCLPGV